MKRKKGISGFFSSCIQSQVEFRRGLSIIVFLFILSVIAALPPWDQANAEDLYVASGQTVTLPGGNLEYGAVVIEGTLNLTGETRFTCYALDLRGTIWYSGDTTITVAKGLTEPNSTEYAMQMSGDGHIIPDYAKSATTGVGKDGYTLTLNVYGHFHVYKKTINISSNMARIYATGQHGTGIDGADGEEGTCDNLSGTDGGNGIAGGTGGKGGNVVLMVSGTLSVEESTLQIEASGGWGGNGGNGGLGGRNMSTYYCHGKPPGTHGSGGDGAPGGAGGDGGHVLITANKIESMNASGSVTIDAGGGGGGRGGTGGASGNFDGYGYGPSVDGGMGSDGAAGGDGGSVKIVVACGVIGSNAIYGKVLTIGTPGAPGGFAGRHSPTAMCGDGIDNVNGTGGDAGEILVVSPAIVNAAFTATGGKGGMGGKARWMSDYRTTPCASTAHSGVGNHGGDGGAIRLVTETLTDPSVTYDVSGGLAGPSGGTENAGTLCTNQLCLNPGYCVIPGAEGAAGSTGTYAETPIAGGNDAVVTVASANKTVAAPGECVDYYVTAMTETPKHDIAVRFEVPDLLRKLSTNPSVPMDMQNRMVQWNVADLLACQTKIFHVRTRIAPTARSGALATRAETFVMGISSGKSEDVVVTIDENRIAHDSCAVPKVGDVNGDTLVDLADAVMLLRFLAGQESGNLIMESPGIKGNRFGLEDLLYVLQSVAGIRK